MPRASELASGVRTGTVGPLDASTTPVVDDKYSIMEIRDLQLLLLVTGSSRTPGPMWACPTWQPAIQER